MSTPQLHETRPQKRTPRVVPPLVPHWFPTPPRVARFEWFPRFPLPVGGTTQHDRFPPLVPNTPRTTPQHPHRRSTQ